MRAYFFAAVTIVAILPLMAAAQAGGLVPCSGPDCTTASVVSLANGLIEWLVTMLGVIAVIALVFAGFKMVISAGDEKAWSSAKELFQNVIIGIILILASWLIIDTLLKMLTDKGLEGWSQELQVSAPNPNNTSIVGGANSAAAGKYTDAEARAALAAAGISVNKTELQGTSLGNINQATVNEAIAFKKACGCSVVITGGTEGSGGHSSGTYSHGSGYKYDMRVSTEVDSYIKNNYSYIGPRGGDGALMYKSSNNVIYAREGDHWDVLVQ